MYLCEVIGCEEDADIYEGFGGDADRHLCPSHATEAGLLMPGEGFYEDEPYTLDVQFLNEDDFGG
jgi:hypothetical protein